MSNRVIKDSIARSSSLAKCSKDAFLAWPHFLMLSDDHGCFEADPEVIKGSRFPKRTEIKPADIEKWLDEYAQHGMLFLWWGPEKKKRYGYFVTFNEHSGLYLSRLHARHTPEPPEDEVEKYLQTTSNNYTPLQKTTKEDKSKREHWALELRIVRFWNGLARWDKRAKKKTLVEQRVVPARTMTLIQRRLKEEPLGGVPRFKEIRRSIYNFRKLLRHPGCRWKYRQWNLDDFLRREKDNVRRFADWGETAYHWVDESRAPTPRHKPDRSALNLAQAKKLFQDMPGPSVLCEILHRLPKTEHGELKKWIEKEYVRSGAKDWERGMQLYRRERSELAGTIKK